MEELMLKIENVSKKYRLGEIGGTTLRDELQRWHAKIHHKEDPTKKIGAKNYNKGETFMALSGVSFEVKKGERVGIIGHNGAGKSTLLKLISRVTAPSDGTISLNGRVTSMLEVGTGFHGELTGRENVYMNGAILGMTKKEIDSKMDEIIQFSEVAQFIDTPVKRYSSGMYVKLAFSVAAHLDSEIMIMDEVLAVGDVAFQKKCIDKMNQVSKKENRTILYVSHNMDTIRQLCSRVIVLDHGKVIFNGDVEKGIEVYVNEFANLMDVDIDLSQKRADYLGQNKKVKLLRFFYINKDKAVFDINEKINCAVVLKSYTDISNLWLRLEIRSMSNIPIAASIVQLSDMKENEEKQIELSFDINWLVPERYKVYMIVYSRDYFGNSVDLDAVIPAFSFEVNDNEGSIPIRWNKRQWGYVQFPLDKKED